jgi:glycerol uptake facilitator-like aquaporin
VVGSGIMGERLSDGNVALALLGNTIATGAILAVLILVFGAVSGAHFNPAVTLAFRLRGEIGGAAAAAYVAVQIVGGLLGTWAAHIMFDEALFQLSNTARSGFPQWFAEFIAAFGLVATILGCLKARPEAVPYAVGLFITAGYWFTASTSFANPAVTIARSLTDTLGAAAATLVFQWLLRPEDPAAVD